MSSPLDSGKWRRVDIRRYYSDEGRNTYQVVILKYENCRWSAKSSWYGGDDKPLYLRERDYTRGYTEHKGGADVKKKGCPASLLAISVFKMKYPDIKEQHLIEIAQFNQFVELVRKNDLAAARCLTNADCYKETRHVATTNLPLTKFARKLLKKKHYTLIWAGCYGGSDVEAYNAYSVYINGKEIEVIAIERELLHTKLHTSKALEDYIDKHSG